jgi:pantoate--beta-alanine ligase
MKGLAARPDDQQHAGEADRDGQPAPPIETFAEPPGAEGERRGAPVLDAVRAVIEQEPLARIDYVELVDPETLLAVETVHHPSALLALAVCIGRTRLIDNMLLST